MEKGDDGYLFVDSKIHGANFYFVFQKIYLSPKDGKTILYNVEFRPSNTNDTSNSSITGLDLNAMYSIFDRWNTTVSIYLQTPFYLEDDVKAFVILNQYQEEFYKEFELSDEDAEAHSYPLQTQFQIDRFITEAVKRLEFHRETLPENSQKRAEIDEIIDDFKNLQDTQTDLTKKEVISKFSKIFAKIRKSGLKLLEMISTEALKEVVKSGVRAVLENPEGIAKTINDILS